MRKSKTKRVKKGKNSNYKPLTNCWFLDYRLKAEHIGILYTIFQQSDDWNMNKTWILDNIGVTPDRNLKAFDELIEFGYIEKYGYSRNTEYIFNEIPYNDMNEYKKIVKQHNKKIGKYTWRKMQEEELIIKSSKSNQSKNDGSYYTTTNEEKNNNITTDKEGKNPSSGEVKYTPLEAGLLNRNIPGVNPNTPPLGSGDPNPPQEEPEYIKPDEPDPFAQEPNGK